MGEHRVFLTDETTRFQIDLAGADEILWRYRTGGSSPTVPLRVRSHVDAQLRATNWRETRWSLTFESDTGSNHTVKGLILAERQRNMGAERSLWILRDWRSNLANVRVDSMFNLIRSQNSFQRPSGQFVDPNTALLNQIPKEAFVIHTCRQGSGGGNQSTPTFSDGNSDNFQPWTALEALKYMLSNNGWLRDYNSLANGTLNPNELVGYDGLPFRFGPLIVSTEVEDNKMLLKNWNPRDRWPKVINDLARMARVHVFAGPGAEVIIQSADPSLINKELLRYGKYAGAGGIPSVATLKRRAPRRIRTHFPQMQEIRWSFDEDLFLQGAGFQDVVGKGNQGFQVSSQTGSLIKRQAINGAPNNQVFLLENVLRMPQDIGEYQKGQWVTIPDALEAWRADTANLPKVVQGGNPDEVFSYTKILRYILSTGLATYWIKDLTRYAFRNPILEARVSAIYNSFRRDFRIPECWLDHIESWTPSSAEIFATSARARQPSPVFVDHHAWDSHINAKSKADTSAQNPAPGSGFLRNNPIGGLSELPTVNAIGNLTRSYQIPLSQLEVGKWSVDVKSTKQGVFTIVPQTDISGETVLLTPGLIDPRFIPSRKIALIRGLGQHSIGSMRLLPTFRMNTLLLMKWRSPNTLARHFTFTFLGDQFLAGSAGPGSDMSINYFPAVRSWEDNGVTWQFDRPDGLLRIDHTGAVENLPVLQEVAAGECRELYFQFRPRVLGVFRAKDWTGQLPIGHVNETQATFKQGKFETQVNAEAAPVGITAWEFFSPWTRDIIARLQQGSAGLLDP